MTNEKPVSSSHLHELAAHGATMLPGPEPDTATRVRLETCAKGGCVHLEQMAYSRTLGWYRQKTFSVPRDMVAELARVLRMSQCLLPESTADAPAHDAPLKFPTPAVEADEASQTRSG